MSVALSQVGQVFLNVFNTALAIDGETHTFSFSSTDGTGQIIIDILVLWVRESSETLRLHSHGYNTVLNANDRVFVIRQADLPNNASLNAGDLLTVDGNLYKIAGARLKDQIYTVTLFVMGSTV